MNFVEAKVPVLKRKKTRCFFSLIFVEQCDLKYRISAVIQINFAANAQTSKKMPMKLMPNFNSITVIRRGVMYGINFKN